MTRGGGPHEIANLDLVERARIGTPPAQADRATYYAGYGDDGRGYTDYPAAPAAENENTLESGETA